jgi:hypothetical protein
MPSPSEVHRRATRIMSALMVVIGVALIVRAVAAGLGGGGAWLVALLGVLFVAAGAGRIWISGQGGRR